MTIEPGDMVGSDEGPGKGEVFCRNHGVRPAVNAITGKPDWPGICETCQAETAVGSVTHCPTHGMQPKSADSDGCSVCGHIAGPAVAEGAAEDEPEARPEKTDQERTRVGKNRAKKVARRNPTRGRKKAGARRRSSGREVPASTGKGVSAAAGKDAVRSEAQPGPPSQGERSYQTVSTMRGHSLDPPPVRRPANTGGQPEKAPGPSDGGEGS